MSKILEDGDQSLVKASYVACLLLLQAVISPLKASVMTPCEGDFEVQNDHLHDIEEELTAKDKVFT